MPVASSQRCGRLVPGRRHDPRWRSGCRAAGRSGRRRSRDSAGSRVAWRTSPTIASRSPAPDRRCSCSRWSGCRSAHRDSGSSTRCRRHRRPLPAPRRVKPAWRRRCSRYRPAKPAPTTATSTCCTAPTIDLRSTCVRHGAPPIASYVGRAKGSRRLCAAFPAASTLPAGLRGTVPIPFLFSTGYSTSTLPPELRDRPPQARHARQPQARGRHGEDRDQERELDSLLGARHCGSHVFGPRASCALMSGSLWSSACRRSSGRLVAIRTLIASRDPPAGCIGVGGMLGQLAD